MKFSLLDGVSIISGEVYKLICQATFKSDSGVQTYFYYVSPGKLAVTFIDTAKLTLSVEMRKFLQIV